MENPWNKLNPKQKKIATIILAFIGVNLFFVGIFLLVRRLFNPPCEMGQKRYQEYGGLCGPICNDTQEVCPKKDDQGNYVTINCVEKCPADKTYDMETCNDKTGYCKKSCKSPAVAVNTEHGWDCGIYCANDSSTGFPDHYCMSTDICGKTKHGPSGKLVSGCISFDSDPDKCDDSNFYCPKDTCEKDASGSDYCRISMCTKTSFCEPQATTNQCTYAGSCSVPLPVPAANAMAKKGIDTDNIGICSVDQNASYEYCTDEQNLGIDNYENLVVCRHGKEGVSLVGDKQCYNALVGENIPCCKYGLCPNGWQCNSSSDLSDTRTCAPLNISFDDFKIQNKTCCASGGHAYTDNKSDKELCCPDILTEDKCLNRNRYPIDKEWANIPTTDELSCIQDGDCINKYKEKIQAKLGTKIDFDDDTSPNYGTIFCNSGKCTLACGALQPLAPDGTIKRPPFLSINVEEDQESPASSFCTANDKELFIETLQGKAFTYPENEWNQESGTALNDNLLLCSTGSTENRYFWAQNDNNHTGDAGNYHNEFTYVIDSKNPADCTKFPLISEDQINAGKITINRDLVKQKGTPQDNDQTQCKARIQCNLAESMGFEKVLNPFDWYQGNKSLANVFPHGKIDMTQRVSKIMGKSVCEDTEYPQRHEDCDLGSPPDKFTADQVVSPCYYNPNYPSTCLPKHVGTTNIPSGSHIDSDSNLICQDSNDNCLPHYIYNGEYCRYGTIDGENCLQNSQKYNSC
jgi:hypothetical protein